MRCARAIPPLLVAALALAGCRGNTPGPYRGAPVVLISIDTLRADHLPAWGYHGVATPAIDALAHDGIVFENAYSQIPLTLPSHSTMLSGLVPPDHGVRDNVGYRYDVAQHPTLPRLLAKAGYRSGGFVSTFVLRADTGIGDGFDHYDSAIVRGDESLTMDQARRPGAETEKVAAQWVREQGEHPFFLFFHLYEPHAPWQPAEPFASRYRSSPYDAEIATADAAVGALLHELRDLGLYDRAVIVLVGDHGEGLGDHGELHHGMMLYRSTLHVPMIVKLPGGDRGGTRVATPVGLVDVTPTVLALTGVTDAPHLDGRSLFAPPEPDRVLYAESYYSRLHYGWSELEAGYDARWSLIDGPQPELFDLQRDPGQQHNVLLDQRRELARLRKVVQATNRPLAAPSKADAETAAKLASLGYLSGSAVRNPSVALPDPRSERDLLATIETGVSAYDAGQYAIAVDNLRRVLARNPNMVDVWIMVTNALAKLQRWDEAIEAGKKALALTGGDPGMALVVANIQLRTGRLADARELAESVRAARPKEAADLLEQVATAQGDSAAAQRILAQAQQSGQLTERMAVAVAFPALQAGRPERALEVLTPFRATANPPARIVLALALSELGRHGEALALLDAGRGAGDPVPRFHEARGIVLLRLDRAAESRAELERAVAADPRLANSWNTLGVALYRLGEPQQAMAAWKRAIGLDSTQYEAMFNLGLVAASAGDRDGARQALRAFVGHAPPDHFAEDIAHARAMLDRLGG